MTPTVRPWTHPQNGRPIKNDRYKMVPPVPNFFYTVRHPTRPRSPPSFENLKRSSRDHGISLPSACHAPLRMSFRILISSPPLIRETSLASRRPLTPSPARRRCRAGVWCDAGAAAAGAAVLWLHCSQTRAPGSSASCLHAGVGLRPRGDCSLRSRGTGKQ